MHFYSKLTETAKLAETVSW